MDVGLALGETSNNNATTDIPLKAHVGRIDFAPSGIGMGHSGLAARRASERGQATNYAGSSRVRLRRASWYTP